MRFPVTLCALAFAAGAAAGAPAPIAGRWLVKDDYYGTIHYSVLDIQASGDKLTGRFGRSAVEGTLNGEAFHLVTTGSPEEAWTTDGRIVDGALVGTFVIVSSGDPAHPIRATFTATRAPDAPGGPPRRFEFTPGVFYRAFSAANAPVLTISPGDTVHTSTVDAGGVDAAGVRRAIGGNPQTGPFYVTGALPGDTLAVHLVRLRLNRDWAISDDAIVDRGLTGDLAVKMKDGGKTVLWKLDQVAGVARLQTPGAHTAGFTIPLRPMLGCIAAAPENPPVATGDSGEFGGNMDFNEITEGATVYLPVGAPGALLYLGDAHAAQGDGELTGDALETSMDVEFTVEVIRGQRPPAPRVESASQIMAMGLGGSIDDAFRAATANMAAWLADRYHLTPAETAEVLGASAHYQVSEAADRNAGVVLRLDKARLATLGGGAKGP
jgi:acetamidase/formamidase